MRRWPDISPGSWPPGRLVVPGHERVLFTPDAARGGPGQWGGVKRPARSVDLLPMLNWPRDLFRDDPIPDRERPDVAVANAWGADWEYAGLAGS